MPYIVVNFVLDILSLILFCMTSAALLSKYPWANLYLPAQVRSRRILAFVAHALVLSVLSIVLLLVAARGRSVFLSAQPMFEVLFFIGLANVVILTYQFMDGRYLRNTPKVPRRLVIAVFAVVMTSAAATAVIAAVLGLFTIR